MKQIGVITPSGSLGGGWNFADFRRCMDEEQIDVIAADSGSTDIGPYYLGTGTPFASRIEIKGELGEMLRAAVEKGIPLVIGTAGGAGARPQMEWMRDIVIELGEEHGWSFKLATIDAELDKEVVLSKLRAGDVHTFESGVDLTPETVQDAAHIVAQMGPEPMVEAFRRGAQVIIAGRSCDDAVIASYPLFKGCDPALALHMGKILECGALAAEPVSLGIIMGFIGEDHFDLRPGDPRQRSTPKSVASHAFYEREDPIVHRGPGGTVDLSETTVEQLDARTARVRGSTYIPDRDYLVKIEGVRRVGYRTVCVAGVHDPVMIEKLDEILEMNRKVVEGYFKDLGIEPSQYRLIVHAYGRDAVMKQLEPERDDLPHELGLVIDAVADTQAIAFAVCRQFRARLMHLGHPGLVNNSGNLALLFSPAVSDMGQVFEFSIYHLMRLEDPLEVFHIEMIDVGTTAPVAEAAVR
jgi:Acyclic terpene utilisation family protein AtuA